MAVIEVNNLTKTYYTYKRGSSFSETIKSFFHREHIVVNAVQDVSFQIEEGKLPVSWARMEPANLLP